MLHSTCPEERLYGKKILKVLSFFIFSKLYRNFFLRGCQMCRIRTQKKLCREKIFFVNKSSFPFTIFEILLWQDYQNCILLVQRNVLMLKLFRREYYFYFYFQNSTEKCFSRALNRAFFVSGGKNLGKNIFCYEKFMFFIHSFWDNDVAVLSALHSDYRGELLDG